MQILTLCGSLRRQSSNRAILQAFEKLAPPGMVFSHYDRVDRLPHFNPDLDGDTVPEEVGLLRSMVAGANAIVISTPEYVHALPGSFKNVLDWLVSDPAFAGKSVVILHVAKGSLFALNSLREILSTMSAQVLEKSSVLLPLESNQIDCEKILARDDLKFLLQESVTTLNQALHPDSPP